MGGPSMPEILNGDTRADILSDIAGRVYQV
jgi:hypothetical protein